MLSNHTPMAVTDADLARAFGTVLDNCPGAIAEQKLLTGTMFFVVDHAESLANHMRDRIQADDLFYKWESYSIQQERTNKANDALQPTMGPVQPQGDHLARFRQYINRDLEKQAHANSIAHTPERKGYGLAVGTPGSQKKAGLLNYGLNRGSKGAMLGSPGFKEPRTYDCSNVDALIQNLASPRTPQKSQRSDHGLGSMASLPPHLRTPTSKTRGASAIFSPQSYVSPSAPSPQSKRFSERVNRGKLEETFNSQLGVYEGTRPANLPAVSIKLLPHAEPYRFQYMHEKIAARAEALDRIIEWGAEQLRDAYQVEEFGHPGQPSQGPILVVGRICSDSEAKLNDRSIVLESSRALGGGARTLLDVSQVPEFAFFPGQIVGLEGANTDGHTFTVTKVLTVPAPPMPTTEPSILMTCQEKRAGVPVQVMAAAGPFTLDDNLEFETLVDFFDVVQGEKPDVVILQGPFLDHRHPLIAQGDVDLSMDEMFRLYIASHFRQLAKTCPHTKIILVPSPRDLLHPYVSLPQPPLEVITKFQLPSNVMCLPNPAQFRINEVHFAVSNVDVLFHLGAEEISRATPTARRMDRLGRLTKHLLDQRNLYPVFPPALHDVNLQYQHLDFLRLPHAPDVLLTSSQLNHFAKKVDNVLCINTGFLTKKQVGGTFAKLSVFPLTALPMPSTTSSLQAPVFSVPHNVSDRTRVDIVRV